MEVTRVEDFSGTGQITGAGAKGSVRQCLYYYEEVCTAPRIKFASCRGCCRINPHQAAANLFEKIKQLAAELLNLKEPEQPPLG
ncbi:MAG: hypothetical protein WC529_02650 [Candidatus Margulisiibacteriota bacterium]